MFQVLYKDREGRNMMIREKMDETTADVLINQLTNSGIEAIKVGVGDTKIHVVNVCFNISEVNSKAKTYTFEDPENIAHIGDIVEVECTDGRRKQVLVTAGGMRSPAQIKEYCIKIGYEQLGKVTKVIWTPRGKGEK